ncbi:GGDEF domain-containing protein [Rhodocyclaceae bacterium SMB388]
MAENSLRPPEIAREALRRLALQRVAPTPDNYRAFYHQIAGNGDDEAFPEQPFKLIASALPRNTAERLRLARQFEQAVFSRQWAAVKEAIVALCGTQTIDRNPWGTLVRDLCREFDRPHATLTRADKFAMLDQVLVLSASDPELSFSRLQSMLGRWAALEDRGSPADAKSSGTATAGSAETTSDAVGELPATAGQLLALLLQKAILPIVSENAALSAEARAIAEVVAGMEVDCPCSQELSARLHALTDKIEWAEEDQRAIRQGLLSLLRLIVDNISELVVDDNWLRGQLGLVAEVFGNPLDIRMLDEVERRLRAVIDKQTHLKRQLTDAQARLKDMLAGFVDRLARFSTSTDQYHDTLVRCARDIEQADNISDLANVVELMLSETQEVQETAKRSSEELKTLRQEVESANHRIIRLQRELDETSEMVRLDPLTGTLNRKGLDEAIEREIAVARRRATPLCIALLDIDNFKQLNDTFGHRTGDEALRHLATVMRESLRPQDLVGRYGGEEFVILLPDTDEHHALSAIGRLQRELTKRFFLAENRRLLITFSAGLARLGADENPCGAIDRADKAMYAAKRAGKNRVLLAA